MKRSSTILLGAILVAAITSCKSKAEDEWVTGAGSDGKTRDTLVNNTPYRHYGGFWYPIVGGMISPRSYVGATANQIRTPGFTSSHISRGGLGSTGRSSSVWS